MTNYLTEWYSSHPRNVVNLTFSTSRTGYPGALRQRVRSDTTTTHTGIRSDFPEHVSIDERESRRGCQLVGLTLGTSLVTVPGDRDVRGRVKVSRGVSTTPRDTTMSVPKRSCTRTVNGFGSVKWRRGVPRHVEVYRVTIRKAVREKEWSKQKLRTTKPRVFV